MDKKKLDALASKVLPPSYKLEKDRDFNAKIILDPDNPASFKRWKDNTNKTDMKGYDTRDRGQPSTNELIKKMNIGYMETEADR